jgi:hypothetical protein
MSCIRILVSQGELDSNGIVQALGWLELRRLARWRWGLPFERCLRMKISILAYTKHASHNSYFWFGFRRNCKNASETSLIVSWYRDRVISYTRSRNTYMFFMVWSWGITTFQLAHRYQSIRWILSKVGRWYGVVFARLYIAFNEILICFQIWVISLTCLWSTWVGITHINTGELWIHHSFHVNIHVCC